MLSNTIIESQSIREILKHVSFDSVLMLDLDNTVMESPLELGSDQWFVQLCLHATNELPATQNPIALVIALYHEIQKIVRAQAVEEVTVKLIKMMQSIGIPVIAITARDLCLQPATTRQLADIGVNLSTNKISDKTLVISDLGKPAEHAFYKNGIIFCNGKDKGKCFNAFLRHTSFDPKHIVMVDDKLKHLEHVKEKADALKIRFKGIRYGYLDEKVAEFDIQQAHMQLTTIKHHLPASIQETIQTLNIPKKRHANATDYLSFFYNTENVSNANPQPSEPRP